MSFSFQNQGYNSFLCYEVEEGRDLDTLSIGMLTNNKINGFAQTVFSQIDTKRYLKYNVTSKVSARQFFAGTVNKNRLLSVFSGIVNAYLAADEYMIDSNSIIFDLDYIFVNVSTCEVSVICLPVSDNEFINDYKTFFRTILLNCQIDQTENCDYYAKLINYFNRVEKLNFEEFNDFLNSLSVNQSAVASVGGSAPVSAATVNGTVSPVAPSVVAPIGTATAGASAPSAVTSAPSVSPASSAPSVPPVPPVHPVPPIRPVQQPIPVVAGKSPVVPTGKPVVPQSSGGTVAAVEDAKKEEKKSGGIFGFLHKEKKSKSESESKATVSPKANGSNKFAIPGQVVPPTVKNVDNIQTGKPVPTMKAPVPPAPAMKPSVPPVAPQPVAPQPIAPQPVAPQPIAPQPVAPQPIAPQPVVPQPVLQQPAVPNMNFGETTVLNSGIGETTVLGVDMNATVSPTPYLIRIKNNERINISKPVFRIGKEKSYVDYFIGDNTAISRSHANIVTRDNEYFIVDTNSTNHTYVDGVMAQSNVETKLKHGVTIRLANEDFEFKLY